MSSELSPPDFGDGAPIAGRRTAPRLRLAIPATFLSIYSRQSCILMDMSRTGARIAVPRPLAQGHSGFIEIDRMQIFGMIVRTERREDIAVNAMAFDDPISRDAVLQVRRFAESFEAREHKALREQVRRWVTGEA